MKVANKSSNGYSPGDVFKEVPSLPPLVEEAATSNTELWLVQLPVNELGPKDLMDKQWSMHLPNSDGKVGHFYSTRGEAFDVVKESMDRKKLYAMMPGSSEYAVRRITSKVCFRRHLEVQKDKRLSGRSKSGLPLSEAKSNDSKRSVQKRALPDDKQTSGVTEASIGNSEIEKERKKEKRKKRKEKKSKSEASN